MREESHMDWGWAPPGRECGTSLPTSGARCQD